MKRFLVRFECPGRVGYPLVLTVALLSVVAFGRPANAGAKAQPVESLTAMGNAVAALTIGCPEIACTSCTFITLTGTLKSFHRFGPTLANANVNICISEDTATPISNGNDMTACFPSSGVISLTGKPGATVSISLAGETCSVPGQSATDLEVVNAAFVVTDSTAKSVSRGSGSFTAFANTMTGDATFTLNGNYSK